MRNWQKWVTCHLTKYQHVDAVGRISLVVNLGYIRSIMLVASMVDMSVARTVEVGTNKAGP